jgi:hypothetical protein
MIPLPSASDRVVLVVRHCGPFAHCHQQSINVINGVERKDQSFFGMQFGEKFGEVLRAPNSVNGLTALACPLLET